MLISDGVFCVFLMQIHTYIPTDDDIEQDQLRKTPEASLVDLIDRSCDARLLIIRVDHPEYISRSLLESTRAREGK